MLFQFGAQGAAVELCGTGAGQDDDVPTAQFGLLCAEALADQPLDAVAVHRAGHGLAGHGHAEAGMSQGIRSDQQGEGTSRTALGVGEYPPVVDGSGQARRARKANRTPFQCAAV